MGNSQLYKPAACCSIDCVWKCLHYGGKRKLMVVKHSSKAYRHEHLLRVVIFQGYSEIVSSTWSPWRKPHQLDEVFSHPFIGCWVYTNTSQPDEKKEPNHPENSVLIYKFIKSLAGIIIHISKDPVINLT